MTSFDEGYLTVGGHLDQATIDKISIGAYVDFSKLIPKDRVLAEDDQRLEMVIRGSKMYYVPVCDGTAINNFQRWKQAFHVFLNVYSKFNANRASELIEYNHVIHTISMTYVWENVYLYDKDFRIHMSHNPRCNWGLILQQAWSLRLQDCLHNNAASYSSKDVGNSSAHTPREGKINEPCRRYNRGRCLFGVSCQLKHCCSYCFKWGHCVLNCRKLIADKERNRNNSSDGRDYKDKQGNRNGSTISHNSRDNNCN